MPAEKIKVKIRPSYIERCKNYLLWLKEPLYMIDESLADIAEGDYSAIEAMSLLESRGKRGLPCFEPRLLDGFKKGKQSREFHVKGWLSMTRAGEALPEEFFGCLGLRSSAEFRGIFGHGPSLQRLRLIHRELGLKIEEYESILSDSKCSVIGSARKSVA
jgi:hypothetical protein